MCHVTEMKSEVINCYCFAWLVCIGLLAPSVSAAHSPHHVITEVESALLGPSTSHTYILITDQVFRSDGQGADWKNLDQGLNNQFPFTSVAISPKYAEDGTLFVASSGDGVFRSTDFGESWEKVIVGLERLDIFRLSISPAFGSDRRLLAASESGGVWRSGDGGDTWQMVLTEHIVMTSISEYGYSPGNAVIIAGDADGILWRSRDNGRLWEVVHEFEGVGALTALSISGGRIFAGTSDTGLHTSVDGGRSFMPTHLPELRRPSVCKLDNGKEAMFEQYITSITTVPNSTGQDITYVTSWYGGVFVSSGDISSWSVWREGISCDSQADRMGESHIRDFEVVRFDDGDAVFWLGTFDGLFRSAGLKLAWQQLETLPLGLIKGMAVSGGADRPLAIALSTYGGGFYISQDNGANWIIGNKGLQTTRLTGVAFSPDFGKNRVIYAGAIRRLLKSSDGGQSWQRIRLDKPSVRQRVANRLASWGLPSGWIAPSRSGSSSPIYPSHIVPLDDNGEARILFGTRNHGVMAFDESDDSAEPIWAGTNQVINSLVMSPDFETDQTLYASIRGDGVFRSDDGGVKWAPVNRGLDFTADWAAHPGRSDFRRDVKLSIANDGTLYAGSPAADGLYISTNRGDGWIRSDADFGVSPAPVTAIAVSPDFGKDGSLIVSVKGAGLFHSTDSGATVEFIGANLAAANASIEYLDYSPGFTSDNSIVAASDEQLFISLDGGKNWRLANRPVRYEDLRDVVSLDGNWVTQVGDDYSALTENLSLNAGSTASVSFVGNGIRWVGSKGPKHGDAEVFIDGEIVATVSCRSADREVMQELFSIRNLGYGLHTIEVRARSTSPVGVDAFDVLP